MLRDMLRTIVIHRPTKFRSNEQAVIEQKTNVTLDEMSKAGLMAGLDGCCRTVVCDEADMTFADLGLFLSCNTGRPAVEMNCRSTSFCSFTK